MPGCTHFLVQTKHEGNVVRLTPVGELDIATTPILERAFHEVRGRKGAAVILIDLAQLSFMDASGIHLLERMAAVCASGEQLRIIDRSPAVKRLLDITGCRDRLPIVNQDRDRLASRLAQHGCAAARTPIGVRPSTGPACQAR